MNTNDIITESKPIAYCLYRVSTVGQVDKVKNDIPMQREICHEFAERQGWIIGKEFLEKGVSGFKVSAAKRDAIQDLKAAALRKEFDILLVFMFDRIGRIDDETPFVVEWFVEQGIEVWSVQEGEQRFDTHVDKLMNYIRFWQAAGESAKTSERIRTRMRQLVEEGIFAKGVVPFGYKLVKRGRLNKKGFEVRDLVINDEEAPYVRRIFEMTVFQNMGTHSIANKLNDEGVRTHNGKPLYVTYIKGILTRKIYCGYIEAGGVSSPKLEEISIISEELWNRAQDIVHQRERNNADRRTISIRTQGESLLAGNIFCAHCGRRLVYTSFDKNYERKDGGITPYRIRRYQCASRTWKRGECSGSASYKADRVDEVVLSVVKDVFSRITDVPETTAVETKLKTQLSEAKAVQKNRLYSLKSWADSMRSYSLRSLQALRAKVILRQMTCQQLSRPSRRRSPMRKSSSRNQWSRSSREVTMCRLCYQCITGLLLGRTHSMK